MLRRKISVKAPAHIPSRQCSSTECPISLIQCHKVLTFIKSQPEWTQLVRQITYTSRTTLKLTRWPSSNHRAETTWKWHGVYAGPNRTKTTSLWRIRWCLKLKDDCKWETSKQSTEGARAWIIQKTLRCYRQWWRNMLVPLKKGLAERKKNLRQNYALPG